MVKKRFARGKVSGFVVIFADLEIEVVRRLEVYVDVLGKTLKS
jgi:hypothetical protein